MRSGCRSTGCRSFIDRTPRTRGKTRSIRHRCRAVTHMITSSSSFSFSLITTSIGHRVSYVEPSQKGNGFDGLL